MTIGTLWTPPEMGALSSSQFLFVGVFFGVPLAGFWAVCTLVHFLMKPLDDPFSDAPHGDEPFLSADHIKALHHGKGDTL